MISRREFVKRAAMASIAMGAGMQMGCEEQGKRSMHGGGSGKLNFIVILNDDMGAFELGCYGNKINRTPNLDRMAAEGVRFKTFFATPVCTPTRVSIMTGRYGSRNGYCNLKGRDAGNRPGADMSKEEITFGRLLQEQGYKTAIAGKWQLPGQLPTMALETGFDEMMMWIYTGNVAPGTEYVGGYFPEGKGKSARYWKPGVAKNGVHFATTEKDYGPDMYSGFLFDFIERHKDVPFFVYYPMCLIHRPWRATPDDPEIEKVNSKEAHIANVEYTDKIIGRLMETLERNGLRENTVVFFIGDNGTQTFGKGTPTEFGARVPGIVSCPGVVREGHVSNELADISDVFPTLAEFAGAPLPADREYDGVSLKDYLTGKTDTHREWIFSYLGHYRILRDKHWLLEMNTVDDFGKFYYCGNLRDGFGYGDVTNSQKPDVVEARKRFEALLEKLPAGPATEKQRRDFEKFTKKHIEVLELNLPELRKRIDI